MPDVTSDPKTTFDLFVTIFTFGSTIAGAAFWVASWRAQMLLKELQLKLQEQHLVFRDEVQKAIYNENIGFHKDVREAIESNSNQFKALKNRVAKIETTLAEVEGVPKTVNSIRRSAAADVDSDN